MKKHNVITLVPVLFLALACRGRAADVTPQTTCPVMGGQIDKSLYVEHEGKRVYVCCPGCLKTVKADPQTYLDKLTAMGVTPAPAPAEQKAAE